jgi:hypothetical protein
MECRNVQRGGWSGKTLVEIYFVKLEFKQTLKIIKQTTPQLITHFGVL